MPVGLLKVLLKDRNILCIILSIISKVDGWLWDSYSLPDQPPAQGCCKDEIEVERKPYSLLWVLGGKVVLSYIHLLMLLLALGGNPPHWLAVIYSNFKTVTWKGCHTLGEWPVEDIIWAFWIGRNGLSSKNILFSRWPAMGNLKAGPWASQWSPSLWLLARGIQGHTASDTWSIAQPTSV